MSALADFLDDMESNAEVQSLIEMELKNASQREQAWLKTKIETTRVIVGNEVVIPCQAVVSPVERKRLLGHRVQILRVLIKRFFKNDKSRVMVNYKGSTDDRALESYLDGELLAFDFDLEAAIKMYSAYVPQTENYLVCKKCGYTPPFCRCLPASQASIGFVNCHSCKNFTPDDIGDAGIGACSVGIPWTLQNKGRLPLFRYADRNCEKFCKA